MRQVCAALGRQRIATLEFTVSSFSSYVAFLEGYARAVAGLESRAAVARSWIAEVFTRVKPEIRMAPAAIAG